MRWEKIVRIMVLVALLLVVGCNRQNISEESGVVVLHEEVIQEIANSRIALEIGEQIFYATLLDNKTVDELLSRLPMTIEMKDLYANEKFYNLTGSLPTNQSIAGYIHAGDLMLYGSDCLVLFYDSFASGYSYTALGKLENPTGLAEAVGSGNVTITFRQVEEE